MVRFNSKAEVHLGGCLRKEFLGRGIGFPFRFDTASGGVAMSEYEANIRDCINVILATRPGERQMMPSFGCRVHEEIFAPNTRSTATRAAKMVEKAIKRWEPRVDVTDVTASVEADGKVRVKVKYKIRSTLSEQELSLFLNASG